MTLAVARAAQNTCRVEMDQSSEYLTRADVEQLTASKQKKTQRTRLEAMGYPYAVSYDGWALVYRLHARKWAAGKTIAPSTAPNLAALFN